MGMMGKLKETQAKVEATKERLNTVLVDEKSSDGLLQITITANREIKSIAIDNELLKDKEQLEDYLILNLNKAIERLNKRAGDMVTSVGKCAKYVRWALEAGGMETWG